MLIRKFLIRLLGFDNYLKIISFIFIKSYLSGFRLSAHEQVNFLSRLVKEGDFCLDIGANLGYFTLPLSKIVGRKGKVIAVEPVPLFRQTLTENCRIFQAKNTEIIPYALGEYDGKTIKMGTPSVDGVIRHGRTEIIDNEQVAAIIHETTMMRPDTLFHHLPKLDFVKCDVEGYEMHIIPLLVELFKKFRPIIEIEISNNENFVRINKILENIGYQCFIMKKQELFLLQNHPEMAKGEIEFYFLPQKNS